MKNNLKGFSFSTGVTQISQKLANATKTAEEFTKEELHKYLKEKFNGTSSAFDALVGDYNPDEIDISGMSLNRGQAVMAMAAMLKQSKIVDMPFSSLVYKSAEIGVNPTGYITTDKLGDVKEIKMVRGLPSTETAPYIIAHSSLTLAMTTSSPETDKVTTGGVQRKQIVGSVPTDPQGTYYPPVDIVNLIDPIEENYKDGLNILDIRAKILTQAKEAGNLMDVGAVCLAAVDSVVLHLKNTKKWKPKWDMFDCVRPIPTPDQQAAYLAAQVDPIQMVPYNKFPAFLVKDIDQMWTFLESHRAIRGSDKGKVSPLTHAVYYGELDNYYRKVTGSADVMYIMKEFKANSVFHNTSSYFSRIWSTLQINCPLITENMNDPDWNGEAYGTYVYPKNNAHKKKIVPLSIDCINSSEPTRNSKTKLWEYSPTREIVIERVRRYFDTHLYAAVKIYPYPELWEDFPDRIYPSLHAHAGTVWILNKSGSPYTREAHISRVVRANVMKTYYACYLQRFPAGDMCTWPTVYVKRSAKRKVNLGFEVLFTDDEVIYDGVDIAVTDVQQKKIATKAEQTMASAPAVKKYTTMKEDMAKKLEAQAPAPTPKPKSVDSHFADLNLEDTNTFGAEEADEPDFYGTHDYDKKDPDSGDEDDS